MSSHSAAVDHDHASHGNLKAYIVGFALSIILTLISFWVVMSGSVPHSVAVPSVVALCVIQLLVQLTFFLHLGMAKAQRENTMIFVFTVIILGIIVGGCLWVLHNMQVNMMPAM